MSCFARILIVITLMSAVSANAVADGCRSYAPSYGYNYGYNYNYNYHTTYYEDYVVSPVFVIGVPVTNLGVPYYYSVGSELREDRIAKRVLQELQSGNNSRAHSSPANGEAVDSESAQPPDDVSNEDFSMVRASNTMVPYSNTKYTRLDVAVANIFSASCAGCHKPGQAKPGKFPLQNKDKTLFSFTNIKAESKRRWSVYNIVSPDAKGDVRMPKNGKPISQANMELVRKWYGESIGE